MLITFIPTVGFANYAEEFEINVLLNGSDSKFMSLVADKQKNATDFTVHDPNGGMTVLCPGAKDENGNPRYSFHSHTDNNTKAKIEITNNYKGDPRKSCNNVSSQIKDVYWVVDFGNVYYYDNFGSLRRCYLNHLPHTEISEGATTPFVTYNLLPSQNPKHGKKGISLSAIYAHQTEEPLATHHEQFLAAGAANNSSPDIGIPVADNDSYACDPRLKEGTAIKVDILGNKNLVGNLSDIDNTVNLNNLAMYTSQYKHKNSFGENLIGVNLIEPGAHDYPSYQFKIINKTGHPIKLSSEKLAETRISYCVNPTGWQTADYVFDEAAAWVSAAISGNQNSDGYTIYEIKNYVQEKQIDKLSKDKIKDLFTVCADDIPPITLNLGKTSPIIKNNASYDISNPFVLDNFDNFYNIELVYEDLTDKKTYVYNLTPTKAYKPITFNQGFHVVTFTIDNSNKVKVTSEPDVPLIIENILQGGAINK